MCSVQLSTFLSILQVVNEYEGLPPWTELLSAYYVHLQPTSQLRSMSETLSLHFNPSLPAPSSGLSLGACVSVWNKQSGRPTPSLHLSDRPYCQMPKVRLATPLSATLLE